MSKAIKKLDDVSKKSTFFKAFEVDKVLSFIKLLFAAPAVGLSFSMIIFLGLKYVQDGNQRILMIMTYYLVAFIFSVGFHSWLNNKISERSALMEWRGAKLSLMGEIMRSQEGLRVGWHNGWREILLKQLARVDNLMHKVYSTGDKTLMGIIMQEYDDIKTQYIKLFPYINNSMEEFQIGLTKPPPHPESTNLEALEEMMKKLDMLSD